MSTQTVLRKKITKFSFATAVRKSRLLMQKCRPFTCLEHRLAVNVAPRWQWIGATSRGKGPTTALVLKVLDHLALFANLGERIDADRKVHVRPIAVHSGIAFAGLDALGRQGLVRN